MENKKSEEELRTISFRELLSSKKYFRMFVVSILVILLTHLTSLIFAIVPAPSYYDESYVTYVKVMYYASIGLSFIQTTCMLVIVLSLFIGGIGDQTLPEHVRRAIIFAMGFGILVMGLTIGLNTLMGSLLGTLLF